MLGLVLWDAALGRDPFWRVIGRQFQGWFGQKSDALEIYGHAGPSSNLHKLAGGLQHRRPPEEKLGTRLGTPLGSRCPASEGFPTNKRPQKVAQNPFQPETVFEGGNRPTG